MTNESVVNQINKSNIAPASAKPMAGRKIDTGGTPVHGPSPQPQKPAPGLKGYDTGNPNPGNYHPAGGQG